MGVFIRGEEERTSCGVGRKSLVFLSQVVLETAKDLQTRFLSEHKGLSSVHVYVCMGVCVHVCVCWVYGCGLYVCMCMHVWVYACMGVCMHGCMHA